MVPVADGAGRKGAAERPAILVGIKSGHGKNTADLAAEYEVVGIRNTQGSFSSTDWVRQQDPLSFDGQGLCRSTTEDAGVYSVADDGTMTVFGLDGIVSGDNRWILLMDRDKSDNDLGLGERR